MNNRTTHPKPLDGYALPHTKVIALRRTGLLADAGDWWYHPSGTFSLAPVGLGTSGLPGTKRARVEKGSTLPTTGLHICAKCGNDFEPNGRRYCSHRCAKFAREMR